MPSYIQTFVDPVLNPIVQKAICTVLALILVDFLTGVLGAVATNTFSSEKMRAGLLHKYMELVCLLVSVILDGALMGGVDIFVPEPVVLATCAYIGTMEVGSILELVKTYNPDAGGFVAWLTSRVSVKPTIVVGTQEAVILPAERTAEGIYPPSDGRSDLDDTNDLGRHLQRS